MQSLVSETPSIGATVQVLLDALKGHPRRDQQTILKMVSQSCGLIAKSEFQPLVSQTPSGGSRRGAEKPRGQVRTTVVKNELKTKRKEINDLNKRISEESTALGSALPDSHELIVKRIQLFRELQAMRDKAGNSADRQNGRSALSTAQAGQTIPSMGCSEGSSLDERRISGPVPTVVDRTPSPNWERGLLRRNV